MKAMDHLRPFKTWDRVATPEGEGFVRASWGGMTKIMLVNGRARVFKDREIKRLEKTAYSLPLTAHKFYA